jgi:hypothetical protein
MVTRASSKTEHGLTWRSRISIRKEGKKERKSEKKKLKKLKRKKSQG